MTPLLFSRTEAIFILGAIYSGENREKTQEIITNIYKITLSSYENAATGGKLKQRYQFHLIYLNDLMAICDGRKSAKQNQYVIKILETNATLPI